MRRHVSVKFKYEKTAATRKGNTERLQTVKQRLLDSGIEFENHGFFFTAEEIPNNIRMSYDAALAFSLRHCGAHPRWF